MNETLVAILTPPGKGALATLGLIGPRAWTVVRAFFTPRGGKALPDAPEPGRRWLGKAGIDLADDGVLALRRLEPTPLVELQVHGGREVSRYLLELFVGRGIRLVHWEEFQGYVEGDAVRSAAAVALTLAPTARTAGILLDQYHGACARAFDQIHAALDAQDHVRARELLAGLARWEEVGRHLTTPFRVVVAGAPNAGKSSLVNALAGYQRSIVSPTPGTTRDVVTTALAFDGWPVELADTAGLRAGGEPLEQAGMEQARLAVEAADRVLWLVDASAEPVWPTAESRNLRTLVSKCDLPAAWDLARAEGALHISATTGAGMAELVAMLGEWLVPETPPLGAAVPFTPGMWEEVRVMGEGLEVEERRHA